MKVLVVGSGGREHALCHAFKKSPLCESLYCAPGNPGIAALAALVPLAANRVDDIVAFCQDAKIDFVMVGPEEPLILGLADRLRQNGIPCFGPSQAAAQLEGSKGFMKDFFARAGIPTAFYGRFDDPEKAKAYVREKGTPIVIKSDGLAAGKGVTIAPTIEAADQAIEDAMIRRIFGDSGRELVIEEFLEGEEASFFAITDGQTVIPFANAQDHKAAFDGDKGPNTGGMGAYSPAPVFTPEIEARVMREIIEPTVRRLRAEGTPYTGVLYAGLMLTKDGPKILEYNVRFGDPETQAMLPRVTSDLCAALYAAATGRLDAIDLTFDAATCLAVVMAATGYPGSYEKGSVIRGLDRIVKTPEALIFHAGTARNEAGQITANGGRVLTVTALGRDAAEAQKKAYGLVDQIDWPEGFCRRDIGWRVVNKR